MNNRKTSLWIGFALLLIVVGGIIGYSLLQKANVPDKVIIGFVGGEKINFLENPKVVEILSKRYNIKIDIRKSGSLDMVRADHDNMDFLWPSSETAVELYKAEVGKPYKDDMIFTTPIVAYSYKPVADALVENKIATQEDDVYRVDMQKLVSLINENKAWDDLGLDLYGEIMIHTTNPAKSNSGNMFSGLVASMLNKGRVAQSGDVPKIKTDLLSFFNKLGYMSTSSSDLFSLYLRNGIGGKTLTAGYENQLLELSKMEADNWDAIKDQLAILYPEPTVWSTHILIALNEEGNELLQALKDPELQNIAWQEHGFRTTVSGLGNAVDEFADVPGVAESVNKIIPMPDYEAMSQIIALFENPNAANVGDADEEKDVANAEVTSDKDETKGTDKAEAEETSK